MFGLFRHLFYHRVRIVVSCAASEHSPIREKRWSMYKDIWLREIPLLGSTFSLHPDLEGRRPVERMHLEAWRNGPRSRVRTIAHVTLGGSTHTPHQSETLAVRGWQRAA